MMSMPCNFEVTSDHVKELIARKNDLEMRLAKTDDNDEECDLADELFELVFKINSEHSQWLVANRHLFPQKEDYEIRPARKLEELHFFRFGKIDRWEDGKNQISNGLEYSIEFSCLPLMMECYNELPADVRLTEADLLAWGEQHLNNEELPTLEDLQTWMSGRIKAQKHLLCNRLVGEYIKHFGDRFVINGAVAKAQME